MNELKISHFSSFKQLLEQISSKETCDALRNNELVSIERNEYFTGTKTFEDALDLANNGWPEGNAIVTNYTKTYDKMWQKFFPQQDFSLETQVQESGSIIIMDEYLKGSPDCMLDFNPDPEKADKFGGCKLQRIIVNACCNCHVVIETIYQRGALIAALVNSMELSGFNVEIIVVWQVARGNKQLRYTLTVKKFQEFLDIQTLTFVLAHPSMLRRLVFRLIEQEPADYATLFVRDAYGYTQDIDEESILKFGIEYGGQLKLGNMYFSFVDLSYNEQQLVDQCVATVKEHFTEITMNQRRGDDTTPNKF